MNTGPSEYSELHVTLHGIFTELHGLVAFALAPFLPLTPILPQDGFG